MGLPFQAKSTGGGGSLVRKFQYFSASGTFYPTQGLLDAGGVVELDIRGGGGGMSTYNGDHPFTAGGSSKHRDLYLITSLAPITVTVGAGGSAGNPGATGGSSAFGTLTIPGGSGAQNDAQPAMGSGNEGKAGNISFRASNSAWNGQVAVYCESDTAWPGSGAGGGYSSSNGKSGSVLVSWWEKV